MPSFVLLKQNTTIAMECISTTHMTHNQSNMALPVVYAADSITPLSIATRENMT